MKAWRRTGRGRAPAPACLLTDVVGLWEIGPELVTITWVWSGPDPTTFAIERQLDGGAWEFAGSELGNVRQFQEPSGSLPAGTYVYRVQPQQDEAPFDCLVESNAFAVN